MVKIKICGNTSVEDALLAAGEGADALGFIFYRKSPRFVSEKTVKNIVAQLPPFVETVGVFVDESAERVNRIAQVCRLDAVQLHGEESPAYCGRMKRKT
ncbi:MAG: phosphoribosylanthranilate isomerase, partial [Nitrospinae bacterium]|nr:phosphoribosylanthranilate isomerase [Nitrospinota bacterium]